VRITVPLLLGTLLSSCGSDTAAPTSPSGTTSNVPVVTRFTADQTTISVGSQTTIRWSVTNPSGGYLNVYVVGYGLRNVALENITSKTITPCPGANPYTLHASNSAGEVYRARFSGHKFAFTRRRQVHAVAAPLPA
jgi:hypothetical protein